jgi:hypothetical protein
VDADHWVPLERFERAWFPGSFLHSSIHFLMTPAIRELFAYARQHVTPEDISRFCPSDPGSGYYVRAFDAILESGTLPMKAVYDIMETVAATIYGEADRWELDAVRFRRFRTLTNVVGITLFINEVDGTEQNLTPNYLAIRLIEDADSLQDETLLRMLPGAFAELQSVLETQSLPEEVPFLLLGQLLLAFRGFPPSANIPRLIEELKAEAATVHEGRESNSFFWDCTSYTQLHERWRDFVRTCFPPDSRDEAVNSLRAGLLCSPLRRA